MITVEYKDNREQFDTSKANSEIDICKENIEYSNRVIDDYTDVLNGYERALKHRNTDGTYTLLDNNHYTKDYIIRTMNSLTNYRQKAYDKVVFYKKVIKALTPYSTRK